MALNSQLFIQSGLESVFRDKDTGLPLANGTIEFFRDSQRNIQKPVYRLDGPQTAYDYSSLGSVITLNSVGSIQDNSGNNVIVYYYPYEGTPFALTEILDLYYVVCKNADGVEQWTREAWPNTFIAEDPVQETQSYDNQVSNTSFTNVFINEGVDTVYTVNGETKKEFFFAPDWIISLSSAVTASVTVSRVALRGSDQIPASPPYALNVSVGAGITECLLIQRFRPNSGLWGNTPGREIYLNGSFVAKNAAPSGDATLQMFYKDSIGSPIEIFSDTFTTSYKLSSGSTASFLPPSTNTGLADDAWADIYLSFQLNSNVLVTQIQVTPSLGKVDNFIPSDLNTSNRDQAYQSDYYIPEVIRKPVESLLVGWDFHLNPKQFVGATSTVENVLSSTNAYILDQTIAQKTATGGLTVTRSSDPVTDGMRFDKNGAGAFYIAQYLDPATAKKILTDRFSVNVFGYRDPGANDVTMRVYLLVGVTEDDFPLFPNTLGAISDDGTFSSLNTGWEEVYRSGLPVAQANLSIVTVGQNYRINSKDNDYGFSGWKYPRLSTPPSSQTLKNAAIVVTFASSGDADFVINSISLTPGDLPCRPPEKTKDQVLQECRYFYELSWYPYAASPPAAQALRSIQKSAFLYIPPPSQSSIVSYPASFSQRFNVVKRKNGTLTIFSNDTTSGNVKFIASIIGTDQNISVASRWATIRITVEGFVAVLTNGVLVSSAPTGGTEISEVNIEYHYSIDARLGIIA